MPPLKKNATDRRKSITTQLGSDQAYFQPRVLLGTTRSQSRTVANFISKVDLEDTLAAAPTASQTSSASVSVPSSTGDVSVSQTEPSSVDSRIQSRAASIDITQTTAADPVPSTAPDDMSSQRNRSARGTSRQSVHEQGEEHHLYQSMLEELNAIVELENRAAELSESVIKLEEQIKTKSRGTSPGQGGTAEDRAQLDVYYRELMKINDELEKALATDENNIRQKLMILLALREGSEGNSVPNSGRNNSRENRSTADVDGATDSPSASPVLERSRKRDGLLNSGRNSVPREPSVKAEHGDTPHVSEPSSKSNTKIVYALGAEVAFRPKPIPGKEDEIEWIRGVVVRIIGDNKTRRYDVQDPEPDENSGQPGQIYRTSASSMVPIPPPGAPLPDYPPGKTVLAQYPHTSTFYRAEVVSMSGSDVTLKFEGEDDAQSTQVVDRRFVLDHRGKVGGQ